MSVLVPPAVQPAPRTDPPAQALADAVAAAGYAPSLNGDQPWRWRLTDDQLDLFEDHTHLQTGAADPRLVLVSCGAPCTTR